MKEILIRKRKSTSKLIIVTSILSVVFYLLMDWQWLNNNNYSLHELMALPYQLFLFLIPLLLLPWIYYSIRTLSELELKGLLSKHTLMNILTTLLVVLIIAFQITRFYGVYTSGVFQVESKWRDGEKYYIVLEDKNVRITRNEYNLINEDAMYLVAYEWNRLRPTIGRLETIELIEMKVAD
jgi:hypothetical protein